MVGRPTRRAARPPTSDSASATTRFTSSGRSCMGERIMGLEAGLVKRFWIAVAIVLGTGMAGGASAPLTQSDLNDFMKKVVLKRDDNWKKFQQYVLDEHEQVEFRGPGKIPLWGDRREYTWYVRDGFFVRSPVKANGVTVPEEQRRSYEKRFLQREQSREKRAQARAREAAGKPGAEAIVVPIDGPPIGD